MFSLNKEFVCFASVLRTSVASLVSIDIMRAFVVMNGNGRTSRLVMNLYLMNHGYNPVIQLVIIQILLN